MKVRARIILKSGKDVSPKRYHPWIFSGAIKKIHGTAAEGDLVEVYSNKDEFLGTGHYQEGSIAVRILSFSPDTLDDDFFRLRLEEAFVRREKLGFVTNPETNVFRLVNAEGDGLPGLIIDYYDGAAVMQFHSIGMFQAMDILVRGLQALLGDRLTIIYDKSSSTLPSRFMPDYKNRYLLGASAEKVVLEYGNRFEVDWERGQKTGFYIDQRESRRLLAEHARGRRVLNLFGYTGGFSVFARRGDASLVHTVDSSARAVELAVKNMEMNFGTGTRHEGITADAFDFLAGTSEKYDLMVLDPPAFAKHHNVLSNALQGYKRLNARAIDLIEPGGIIFTFSCSQAVSRENFRKSVFAAAANTGRRVSILHQLSQPPDHPVSIYHPEGEYLKGLVLRVD